MCIFIADEPSQKHFNTGKADHDGGLTNIYIYIHTHLYSFFKGAKDPPTYLLGVPTPYEHSFHGAQVGGGWKGVCEEGAILKDMVDSHFPLI